MVGKINSRFYPGPEMNISQAFNIENNEVISLVGSGGKTTLMFTIARELSLAGNKVITTTTTKIASHEPEKFGSPLVILKQDEQRDVKLILDHLNKNRQITVAAGELPEARKLKGLKPEIIDRLAEFFPGWKFALFTPERNIIEKCRLKGELILIDHGGIKLTLFTGIIPKGN